MKPFFSKYSLLLALVVLVGCGKAPAPAPSPSDQVLAVVRGQLAPLKRQGQPAVMAVLDPESPGFEQTRAMTEKIFKDYDLRYTFKDLAVESITNDEAHVRFSQVTEKVSGPAFRNNRVDGEHILKKRNGAWKISSTQANNVAYLDK